MNFKEVLNKYLKELNCSSKKLSNESGLSESVISRYRSGERTPVKNSEQLNKLTKALFNIAKDSGKNKYTFDKIVSDFNSGLTSDDFDYTTLSNNLNTLITSLNINTHEMSKYIVFDASHISRIRYGKARPSNPIEFSNKICSYIFNRYKNPDDIDNLMMIIGCKKSDLSNEKIYSTLFNWLTSEIVPVKSKVSDFLHYLDSFNLDDYIKAIHFDELKVPTLPITIPKSKNYFGLEEMKQGELDFLKGTVLSKSKNDVFMCSDMQMDDLAKDLDFGKKWMFGIAMMLKKGLNLKVIHNLDRPFNEMMLGLESWIPMYMTGQVTPFYLKNYSDKVYSHLNYVSNNYALCGECINGFHKKGKYYLTNNKKEIQYYQEKAKNLLNKATSLMEIYNDENKNKLDDYYKKDAEIFSARKRILSSLPLHTMSMDLFTNLLKDNNLEDKDISKLQNYLKEEKTYIKKITEQNILTDEISLLSKEDFEKSNIIFNLNKYTTDYEIKYTYNTYLKHLEETKKYKSKNYKLIITNNKVFNNIDIYINQDNYVIISKKKHPHIHFVIKHEKLRSAIENFIPPVVENGDSK